jgi:crotonobetainyl-CoA:carnitine CoA-transferase CaiB-like acyl-CoA transferase
MDVSIMAAGPWTGALLGMLGAEVIKVEPPAGDGTRWVMPTQRGMGTNYLSMNVNKKGVVIDLKTPEGRAQGMELLGTCDVFVQNFRGGVIERLGFGYDVVRAANPRLVYCAISGFGETGPLAKAGCADPIMQAFSGFARANGALHRLPRPHHRLGGDDVDPRGPAGSRPHRPGPEGRGIDARGRTRDPGHAPRRTAGCRSASRADGQCEPVVRARPGLRNPRP